MKKLKIFTFLIAFFFISGNAIAGDISNKSAYQQIPPDSVINTFTFGSQSNNGFNPRHLQKANFKCGFKPFPPFGCKVGACVCDRNGNNCQWTFVCK